MGGWVLFSPSPPVLTVLGTCHSDRPCLQKLPAGLLFGVICCNRYYYYYYYYYYCYYYNYYYCYYCTTVLLL